MTVIDFARDTRDTARDTLTDDEKRDRARADWTRAHAAGETPPTGKELAARYDMSAKWGQNQAAAARAAAAGRGTPVRAAVPQPAVRPVPPVDKPAVPRHASKPARGKPAAQPSTLLRYVTNAAVAIVALVAAATSYSHMHALALEAGESELVAFVLPLSVDGLVVAATMTILSARGKAGVLPWLALLLGLGASLAANVAAAEPTVVGRLVAAWPPVALALSFEMLLRQTRER